MASIVYRTGREKPWLVRIKRKGHPAYSKAFRLKPPAEKWARQEEDRIEQLDAGMPDKKKYLDTPVSVLAARYLAEISPAKASFETEKYIITHFLEHRGLARKPIALVSTQDGADYRNERLKETHLRRGGTEEPIKPSTVRREINILQHIFKIAKTEWGYSDLKNPFEGLRIRQSDVARTRRLKDGEWNRLLKSAFETCRGHNKRYAPLAMVLAVETGMRLQEIFNLTWGDLSLIPRDHNQPFLRRIRITKSKTGKGRTIVMDAFSRYIIGFIAKDFLMPTLVPGQPFPQERKIFPMTKKAFKQTWELIKRNAGIDDLTFHVLRHEAGSRFDEIGLTKGEHDLMMGHKNRDMASRYTHTEEMKLMAIQEKLDKKWLEEFKSTEERIMLGLPLDGSVPSSDQQLKNRLEEVLAYAFADYRLAQTSR